MWLTLTETVRPPVCEGDYVELNSNWTSIKIYDMRDKTLSLQNRASEFRHF